MNTQHLIPFAVAVALLAACGKRDDATTPATEAATAPSPAGPPVINASAQIAPAPGQSVTGTLSLTDDGSGVRISGSLQGLPPNGEFGFHIHENGDCSAPDFSSAGAHFNVDNAPHGNPQGGTRHAGDMLNAKSDAQGVANVDVTLTTVSLAPDQPNGVRGRAIVVHEKADDYTTQPSGNSGARVACGVIDGLAT
jgi:Cu-Zn family superoxide dismutase